MRPARARATTRRTSSASRPPTSPAALHMGHALNGSIQDVLIRWHRMRGFDTLWQPGYDHAGISTQNVVERALAKEGRSRQEIGREAFVELTWEWLERLGAHDHGPVPPRSARRSTTRAALHDGRRLRPRRHDVLRPALGSRLDLPRQPHRQLVPVPSDGDLRPRGRARGDGRHAVHDPLPVRGRRRTRRRLHRDRPAGHDPRRRRGRRASRTIRAIAMRSAARWSFPTSSIAFLSSPTSGSTASSVRARSR